MSTPIATQLRSSLIVIREGSCTKKLSLPPECRAFEVETDDGLATFFAQARQGTDRIFLLLSEEHLNSALALVRTRLDTSLFDRTGIIVIAKEAESLLPQSHAWAEVLDIVSEKEFRKSTGFHIHRAVRHFFRAEEKRRSRVNRETLEKLNEILMALSAIRDPEKLLATILVKAIDLTNARSGTLYMIEERDGELYFRLRIQSEVQNEVNVRPVDIKVLENSISGYVALTGKSFNARDVNDLRPMSLPQLNRSMDHYTEGKTKSLLSVPFKNSRNEIIAVLQLANKNGEAENTSDAAFENEDESLLSSFATQAAICLENVDLYKDIQRLFEGFVKASITAIESRDPSTGGHSERVAKLCVAIARATTEVEVGIYRSVKFKEEEIRELEYAALLHDFGKIGVREEVLVKAKKLYPWQLDSIKERIKVCKAAAKIAYLEKRLKGSSGDTVSEKEYMAKVKEIDNYWEIILAANEPAVLKRENMEALERIRNEQLLLPDGAHIALLSEEEYSALSVRQGSLTENERLEIESHVRHTYQFLKMIPWTRDFKRLPEIAYAHHEKLDGTGYPRGLTSHEIPLQSKIMTISDIFDALTAADRWYKEAVPTERALAILGAEVAQGKIDPVLYELFVEKKLYEATQPKLVKKVG